MNGNMYGNNWKCERHLPLSNPYCAQCATALVVYLACRDTGAVAVVAC